MTRCAGGSAGDIASRRMVWLGVARVVWGSIGTVALTAIDTHTAFAPVDFILVGRVAWIVARGAGDGAICCGSSHVLGGSVAIVAVGTGQGG